MHQGVVSTALVTNPKCSTIDAAMNKVNSLPARSCTYVNLSTSIEKTAQSVSFLCLALVGGCCFQTDSIYFWNTRKWSRTLKFYLYWWEQLLDKSISTIVSPVEWKRSVFCGRNMVSHPHVQQIIYICGCVCCILWFTSGHSGVYYALLYMVRGC